MAHLYSAPVKTSDPTATLTSRSLPSVAPRRGDRGHHITGLSRMSGPTPSAPRPRLAPHWRHRVVAVLAAALLLLSRGVAPAGEMVARAQDDATPAATREVPPPPDVSAAAAIAVDIDSDQVLYALNADEPRAPASTTKMATALVVTRNVEDPEGVNVVVEEGDTVDVTVFSNMGFEAGDTLTVQDLLYGLLLPSGNDAAKALARTVGADLPGGDADPTKAFVDAMNALAADLGATETTFKNPAGEDEEGQVSTARDLAIIAAALLDDPILATIVATPEMYVVSAGPEARGFNLVNTNQTLLREEGILGVKTGTTEAAGGCLVAAARVAESRVVTVVLGSEIVDDAALSGSLSEDPRFVDTLRLIRGLFQDYEWVSPTDQESVPSLASLEEALAVWGVTMDNTADLVVPAGSREDLSFRLRLGPSGQAGDEVGRVLFFAGPDLIAERPLYQM
ncbi:MAG: D-alanyl-D-alanine carboxypeptidase [uncultured Thermomicrobiales bacterium]|uniref:D-alanyl-D-alanine carboxypeptidase n=1 Tax=uncultured Thermomicrobiales bacterium TaxID=1645740 RepID=A0A6J4VHR5_9BACT|nr:MAG: D-alanyl-D-alanine carboxypeptidase [uncultured Thermomicrobiales bacterium]